MSIVHGIPDFLAAVAIGLPVLAVALGIIWFIDEKWNRWPR